MKNFGFGSPGGTRKARDPHQDSSSLYLNPRSAPRIPSSKSSFRSLRQPKPNKPPSVLSVDSTLSNPDSVSSHPYAAMHLAPMPVVSNTDSLDDEEDCPVCLEPLSFSFRLPGEKPHIVPECGHALHEVRPQSFPIVLHSTFFRPVLPPFMAHRRARASLRCPESQI
jgi:hypothetical protein